MDIRKINNFKLFWERKNTNFLMAICRGNYFVNKRYEAAREFLEQPREVSPDEFKAENFKKDYLRIFEQYEAIKHDGIFTAVPFTGLPWIEAMAGCRIFSTSSSFVAKKNNDVDCRWFFEHMDKRWLDLYISFTDMLCEIAGDFFPVGQPILRGPCDLAGTLIGQKELVYYFYDEPDLVKELIEGYENLFLEVVREQKRRIPSFHGGYSIGFYDLWCPGECIWFQDDLTSLLSPKLYEQFILPVHRRLSALYEYSLIHLHPASFFILDHLLDIKDLKCIQVNKDVGGPSVKEMAPYLRRIQKKKNLVISGDFTNEELEIINSEIPPQGVYIICIDSPE